MCYTVPLSAAIVTHLVWKKNKDVKFWWLNLMFWGGALFGIIDHLWNGELFLISGNLISDLLLGVVISIFIFSFWAVLIVVSKRNKVLSSYLQTKY